MRGVSYTAFLLCLLLALNEFGPAHFMRIESRDNGLSKRANNRYVREDQDSEDDESTSAIAKRGIGSTIFKVIKFGGEFFSKTATLASMISTIYLLIEQCCGGKWKKTCEWHDEVDTIQKELESKGRTIEEMELEIKNLQERLVSSKKDFGEIVTKMNEIGKASGRLLKEMDPQMEMALNKTYNNMTALIKERQKIGEKVKYIEVETEFFGVMDGILGVAVPMFTTIIPSVPKLIKWAKARMGRYKIYELDHSVDAKPIEPPDINDAKYHSSKSWFGKHIKQITYEIDSVEYTIKTKYEKAYARFQKVKEYFTEVFKYASAAYSIYSIMAKFKKCDTAYEQAEKAVKEMRKAKTRMDGIYDATVDARQLTYEARDSLKKNLTQGVFVDDLSELKANLDLIKGYGIDQRFRDVLTGIGNYVTDAPQSTDSNFQDVERLLRALFEDLYQLPKYYDCYTNKVAVIGTVLRRCEEGDQSLKRLNEEAKLAKDVDWESCQTLIGMTPITDDALEKLIEKESAKKNFNKICELNSASRKESVCLKKCNGGDGAKNTNIAELLDVSVDVVDTLLKGCKVCQSVKNGVCRMRKYGAPNEEIHSEIYPQYSLKEIKDVQCP